MNVSDLYLKYMTPLSLQHHMLRTAALAQILLSSWMGIDVNRTAVITACLFHDIAKPMTFDLTKQLQFGMNKSDIKKLAKFQKYVKDTYGTNEHYATVKICEEIGLSNTAVLLVNNLEWSYLPRLLRHKDIVSIIPIYSDMRIAPKGILSLDERLQELENRVGDGSYAQNIQNGTAAEEEIKKYVGIDVNAINDDQLSEKFKALQLLKI